MLAALGVMLAFAGSALSQESYSHARIVRLSFTQGTVSIERPGATEWEAAPTNTPIEEGFKLSTAASSYAEVEFENSSTARLGEQSELDFTQLALASNGAKINRMELAGGYATFTVMPESGDVYEVKAGDSTLSSSGSATFRVDLEQGAERVEVFKGLVSVSSPYGSSQLAKDDVLEIEPGADQAYVVTHGITPDDWDKWVDSRQQVLTAEYDRQAIQAPNPYPDYSSMYGWNDLMYYGDWNYVPGYGYGWCPYVGAGWMPYTVGQWMWYPGLGWTWISAEPWGWMPFHYGYWTFVGGGGWYWFPNGLGPWSPALVSWYQGNGWVGWWPRIAPGRGPACAPGGNCIVAVGSPAFQRGRMISAGDLLNVQATAGRSVSSPAIAPLLQSPLVRGRIVTGPAAASARSAASGARASSGGNVLVANRRPRSGAHAPSVVLLASTSAAARRPASPSSGIVFDSRSRSYVNSPNPVPATGGRGEAGAGTQSAPAHSNAPRVAAGETPQSRRPAYAPEAAPAAQPEHHWDFFGLLGNRNSPESGPQSGSNDNSKQAPAAGQARGQRSSPAPRSAPARISAPREAPAPRSEPAVQSAPSPHFSNSSGGGGGAVRSSGGGGGHAPRSRPR
jgi:Family of unknown function (DUF6600)/FecR protein